MKLTKYKIESVTCTQSDYSIEERITLTSLNAERIDFRQYIESNNMVVMLPYKEYERFLNKIKQIMQK